jgi:hypothetical protein
MAPLSQVWPEFEQSFKEFRESANNLAVAVEVFLELANNLPDAPKRQLEKALTRFRKAHIGD